jgi:hypothetical protein
LLGFQTLLEKEVSWLVCWFVGLVWFGSVRVGLVWFGLVRIGWLVGYLVSQSVS